MKRIIPRSIVYFFFCLYSLTPGNLPTRIIENNSFLPEEKLSFELKWGFIKAGEASMEVNISENIQENPVWKISAKAWSTGFVDTFFKVRDLNESWIDSSGLFSYRFRKELNEGNYHKVEETIYDYARMKALVPGRGEVDIESCTHDILSSFFYIRTQKLEPGGEYFLSVTTELKKWRLRVKVIKREPINSYLGLTNTILIEPVLIEEGIFRQKGALKIWLTDDDLHLPVKMASKIFIGSIVANLTGYHK